MHPNPHATPAAALPDRATTDPARCPLCGGSNRCAMEVERETGVTQPPCWCTTQTFSPDLLASLPAPAQGKACICAACLAAFNRGAGVP